MKHILRCESCKIYTLNEKCPECGNNAVICIPPKYTPEDKYGRYRRKAKTEQFKKEGLI